MIELFIMYLLKTAFILLIAYLLTLLNKIYFKKTAPFSFLMMGWGTFFLCTAAAELFYTYKDEAVIDLFTIFASLIVAFSLLGSAYIHKKADVSEAIVTLFSWFLLLGFSISMATDQYVLTFSMMLSLVCVFLISSIIQHKLK